MCICQWKDHGLSFQTSLDLNLRTTFLGCVKLGKLSGSWNLSLGFVLIYKERKYRHIVHTVHNLKDEMINSHSQVPVLFMSSIHLLTCFLPHSPLPLLAMSLWHAEPERSSPTKQNSSHFLWAHNSTAPHTPLGVRCSHGRQTEVKSTISSSDPQTLWCHSLLSFHSLAAHNSENKEEGRFKTVDERCPSPRTLCEHQHWTVCNKNRVLFYKATKNRDYFYITSRYFNLCRNRTETLWLHWLSEDWLLARKLLCKRESWRAALCCGKHGARMPPALT